MKALTSADVNKALSNCGGVKRYVAATPYTIYRVTRVKGGWAWWIRFPEAERRIVHPESSTVILYKEALALCK